MTDLFAGAGGTTTGATQAGGEVVIAANHWPLAVETHNENYPATKHDCADISQVDPRRYPHTMILSASPECTNHSQASGKKRDGDGHGLKDLLQPSLFDEEKPLPDEARERSRATMWDVPRFAEYHRYPVVIVENVVESSRWAPYGAWLQSMQSLGYDFELISHNSMHAQMFGLPAPQSRDRLYVAFWDKRLPRPEWEKAQRPQSWCETCGRMVESEKKWKHPQPLQVGKYRTQYVYVCSHCTTVVEPAWLPASSAIDWGIPCVKIGERMQHGKRPLSEKTLARVRRGLELYGHEPMVTDSIHNQPLNRGITHPMPTQTTTFNRGLIVPVEGRKGKEARPVHKPLRTMTTRNESALLLAYYGSTRAPHSTNEAMRTLTTVDRYSLIDNVTQADIDECGFRMLEPSEYASGMAFPETYKWHGTKRERVKLAGNAVTPPVARDLYRVAIEALEAAA